MKRWIPNLVLLTAQIALIGYSAQAVPTQEGGKALRVQSLQIVDQAGRVRAELGVHQHPRISSQDLVALTLRDEQGKEWVSLRAEQESGTLVLGSFGRGIAYLSSNYPSQQRTVLALDRGGEGRGGGLELVVEDTRTRVFGIAGESRIYLTLPREDASAPELILSQGQRDLKLAPAGIQLLDGSLSEKPLLSWPAREELAK